MSLRELAFRPVLLDLPWLPHTHRTDPTAQRVLADRTGAMGFVVSFAYNSQRSGETRTISTSSSGIATRGHRSSFSSRWKTYQKPSVCVSKVPHVSLAPVMLTGGSGGGWLITIITELT